jgi:hypothetical protein
MRRGVDGDMIEEDEPSPPSSHEVLGPHGSPPRRRALPTELVEGGIMEEP